MRRWPTSSTAIQRREAARGLGIAICPRFEPDAKGPRGGAGLTALPRRFLGTRFATPRLPWLVGGSADPPHRRRRPASRFDGAGDPRSDDPGRGRNMPLRPSREHADGGRPERPLAAREAAPVRPSTVSSTFSDYARPGDPGSRRSSSCPLIHRPTRTTPSASVEGRTDPPAGRAPGRRLRADPRASSRSRPG